MVACFVELVVEAYVEEVLRWYSVASYGDSCMVYYICFEKGVQGDCYRRASLRLL